MSVLELCRCAACVWMTSAKIASRCKIHVLKNRVDTSYPLYIILPWPQPNAMGKSIFVLTGRLKKVWMVMVLEVFRQTASLSPLRTNIIRIKFGSDLRPPCSASRPVITRRTNSSQADTPLFLKARFPGARLWNCSGNSEV